MFAAPPLSEQFREVRARAAADGLSAETRNFDARGADDTSYLVVLKPETPAPGTWWKNTPASDELRVYDVHRGRLQLRFRFRPKELYGTHLVFRVDSLDDLDGSGADELIGSYAPVAMGAFDPIPVVLRFDDGASVYKLQPLVRQRPDIAVPDRPRLYERGAINRLRTRVVLKDAYNPHLRISGYHTEQYQLVSRGDTKPLLVTSYLLRAADHADSGLHQIEAFRLDVNRHRPILLSCYERVRYRPDPRRRTADFMPEAVKALDPGNIAGGC
ncbi:MAG: hypothetical protein J7513_07065 [Solirubrobacteraceae bacterium]|nr:hypothetical protein [Solirubrobacteraceae bacterium]